MNQQEGIYQSSDAVDIYTFKDNSLEKLNIFINQHLDLLGRHNLSSEEKEGYGVNKSSCFLEGKLGEDAT